VRSYGWIRPSEESQCLSCGTISPERQRSSIRTGLALMGFGFVVARFSLFLQEIRITQGGGSAAQPHLFSLWFGTALIVTGVAVNLFSVRRHISLIRNWNCGQFLDHRLPRQAIILALFLPAVGTAMAIYLSLAF
jgi:putative membrane protein